MNKNGLKDSLPIVLGYIPVALAYGILSKTNGVSLLTCFLLSAVVYAGASQFIAINLIALHVGIGEIILTTFLVNIRHILMSASLVRRFEKHPKLKFLYAFGMTDEFFSVASFSKTELKPGYTLTLAFIPYLTWLSFSVIGYLLGHILPDLLKESMNIALYALFIALIIPEVKKHHVILLVTLSAGIVNTLCYTLLHLPQGWSIVIAVISVSGIASRHPKVKAALHG